MRAVVQRVRECAVEVDGRRTGAIGSGLLVYLGISREDTTRDVQAMADKVLNLRILPDAEGKMNRSLAETREGVLVISQFTLYGDARKGRRPSYTDAAAPETARPLYEAFLSALRASGLQVACGEFQAIMAVSYTNVGPVTILLDSHKAF